MFRSRAMLTVLLATLAAVLPAQAREYNKRTHIPPGQRAKVNNAIAQSWQIRATAGRDQRLPAGADIVSTSCGSLEVGRLPAGRPGRPAPREQIIVAGDIININQNCRSRR